MRRRRCVSSKKCEFLWRLRNTVTRRSAKMSEPKYAGTKRKNNSQYTSYLGSRERWGEWLYFGFDWGHYQTLLTWPTAGHLKFLTIQYQRTPGPHAKLKLSLSLLRVNAFAMIKQAWCSGHLIEVLIYPEDQTGLGTKLLINLVIRQVLKVGVSSFSQICPRSLFFEKFGSKIGRQIGCSGCV